MNRCPLPPTATAQTRRALVRTAILTTALLVGVGVSAQVYDRPFPTNVKRGVMMVTQPPDIQMDGRPDRLSPGSRIRAANNMLVLSGALVGQSYVVNYLREPTGMVHEVWILTESEASKPLPVQAQ